jgi:hypothetical protein
MRHERERFVVVRTGASDRCHRRAFARAISVQRTFTDFDNRLTEQENYKDRQSHTQWRSRNGKQAMTFVVANHYQVFN